MTYSGGGGGDLVAKSCLTFAIPWTVACQGPLSMGFSRQEYGSGFAVSYSIKAINLSNISYNGKPWERLVKCVKFKMC